MNKNYRYIAFVFCILHFVVQILFRFLLLFCVCVRQPFGSRRLFSILITSMAGYKNRQIPILDFQELLSF